jgi:hypothetical protein
VRSWRWLAHDHLETLVGLAADAEFSPSIGGATSFGSARHNEIS